MEECFTHPLPSALSAHLAPSVATGKPSNRPRRMARVAGPKETTLAALRSFARAYRSVALGTMPDAPGLVLN